MEYRIHSQNGYKTSLISLDMTLLERNKKNLDTASIESILLAASAKGINLISASIEDKNLIKTICTWQKKTKAEFLFALHIGRKNSFLDVKDSLKSKKKIYQNRFEEIEKYIKKIKNDFGEAKVPFLSLYFAKSWHFKKFEIQSVIEQVKEDGLIQSFGIYCQYLSDAIYLANSINIDHLEIDIDINSSSELLHTLFKTAKKRNIAIICHQKEIISEQLSELKNSIDSLDTMLKLGYNNFVNKIENSEISELKNIFDLALKKNIMEDYQSITIKISDLTDITFIESALHYPYLSFDESELLHNSINPYMFPSPKKT